MKTLLLSAILALTTTACQNGFLTGGTSDGPNGPGGTNPDGTSTGPNIGGEGPDCQPLDRFYLREIYAPALKGACAACHAVGGEGAEKSDFVLYNKGRADYLQINLLLTKEFAQIERDGESILLLKPLGKVSHGGGQVIDEGDDVYNRLKAFIEIVKTTTDEGCTDNIDDSFFADVEFLDAEQTMRKATLNLAGRLPTAEEIASGDLDSVLDNVMQEDAFYDRLTEHWNDLLLTDQFLPNEDAVNLLDEDVFPNRMYYDNIQNDDNERNFQRDGANYGLTRESIALMNHVIRNDRPFTEIMTADYTVVNPMSAQSYGLNVQFADDRDMNEFVEAQIPGIPHAGLFTNAVYMNKFPTTATNRNRHRSLMFYTNFMATNILEIADRPIDAVLVDQTQTPTLFSAVCTGCHTQVEPVAGAFQNWDENGLYNPRENGWYTDMFPAGFDSNRLPDAEVPLALQWLTKEAVKDQRFAYSAIEHAYKLVTGGDTLPLPSDATRADFEAAFRAYEVQVEFFKNLVEDFVASNYDFKVLIKDIVKSTYFRANNAAEGLSGERQLELSTIGTTVLLGPERLHRKIQATTGVTWNVNGRDQLLDNQEFLFLYGGLDSISSVTRMTELNSIAASIARRMSHEVSCLATAADFDKAPNERLLFPGVETNTTDEAAVREGIVHLYFQLLGERYATSDQDVDIAYNLFSTVRQDYQNNGNNGLPGRCQSGGVNDDPDATVRSWMAVVAMMLADYNYLYY